MVGRRPLIVSAACTVAGASTQAATLAPPFEAAAPGGLPAGFSVGLTGGGPKPVWSVLSDTAEGAVLAQTSTDGTDYRFPLAICDKLLAADVDVSVRFKAVAGRVDRAAGIAIRLTDADNYYVVRANALEDNVNFYRVAKGIRREIQGASAKVPSFVWHTLALRAEGDRFTVSFNGKPLFTVSDRTFSAPGKVALWTKADSVTHFSHLTIGTRG